MIIELVVKLQVGDFFLLLFINALNVCIYMLCGGGYKEKKKKKGRRDGYI